MIPKAELYGRPEDWIYISLSENVDIGCKVPPWKTLGNAILGWGGNPPVLELNQQLDNSISFCGIGADSPISTVHVIDYVNREILDSITPDVTNWFLSYYNSRYVVSTGGYSAGVSQDNYLLSPIENLGDTNIQRFLRPIVDIDPAECIILISIEAVNSDGSGNWVGSIENYEAEYSEQFPNIVAIWGTCYSRRSQEAPIRQPWTFNNDYTGCYVSRLMEYPVTNPDWGEVVNYAAPSPSNTAQGSGNNRFIIWGSADRYDTFPAIGGADDTLHSTIHRLVHEYDREWVLSCAASLGLFFTYRASVAESGELDSEYMYLGTIDSNGITHGNYTRGTANREQPQFSWTSTAQESTYDPTKPPPPSPSTDPITPYQPGLTLAGAGTGLWAMTKFQVEEFMTDVFGGEAEKLKDKLVLFGSNPMNAVISLRWYPMAWSSTRSGPVILGTTEVSKAHQYPLINSPASSYYSNSGTLNIMDAYDRNFYNSRHIQARLWLPFYGFYELPSTVLLSKQIELELHFNLPDELAVWIISFDNVIYDFCECSMGIDIPLTGSNAAAITEAKRQAAISIASQIASTAATTVLGLTAARGIANAANYLAGGMDVLAEETLGYNLETQAYLGWGRAEGKGFMSSQAIGMGSGIVGAGINIANTVHQTKLEIANLKTNLPFHGAAGQTTFLNFPLFPYIQIFRNNIMSTYDEEEYQLKVGHACDIWAQLSEMPDNSLLQTTGMANMSSNGMEMAEVQELNSILQSGFYK